MGTGFELSQTSTQQGIIPRAVKQLFDGIRKRQDEARERGQTVPEFKVSTQFMELYNEEIHDLFDNSTKANKGGKSGIRIHEDSNGNIYTVSRALNYSSSRWPKGAFWGSLNVGAKLGDRQWVGWTCVIANCG